jgi:hypothetical protein
MLEGQTVARNETEKRDAKSQAMKVRTNIKAGALTTNHNQTAVRK